MFLSTIQPEYAMEFKDIRDYVLNKDATKFDNSKYRINMYLLKKYEISHSGVIGLLVKIMRQQLLEK